MHMRHGVGVNKAGCGEARTQSPAYIWRPGERRKLFTILSTRSYDDAAAVVLSS